MTLTTVEGTEGFYNSKNDVVYAKASSEIPADLRNASISKYPAGIMCWGGICTKRLIPQDGPINFTQWLQDQRSNNSPKRLYMTGELYARFLDEEGVPAIAEAVEDLKRFEPNDEDAKFSDVWPIESVWGIPKEKTQAQTFDNLDSLADFINLEWCKITPEQCEAMIDKIPKRLVRGVSFGFRSPKPGIHPDSQKRGNQESVLTLSKKAIEIFH
ncbi:unnamed protein product [Didymodactylos carnosus]|uniref:Uncharacterized protein n=1 Tax=Didymodactylos carnosus TaxID=1234261 RepID=A0A8S2FF08_9BILA|nr:unnamed protein product [Didymodactylos carnosus]CAF4242371.1 unnamed protein product [Didymodactylos carnosus]